MEGEEVEEEKDARNRNSSLKEMLRFAIILLQHRLFDNQVRIHCLIDDHRLAINFLEGSRDEDPGCPALQRASH